MAEGKNTEVKAKGKGVKCLMLCILFLIMAYLSLHIYFIWQPVGKPAEFNQAVIDVEVGGVKMFPAIVSYDLDKIDGRAEILKGDHARVSPLPRRLATAIERNEPVSFTESEVNLWLRKRLMVKQVGLLNAHVDIQGVWVNFGAGEIEFVIERVLQGKMTHVVTLFMKFNKSERGFSIHRHASHVGQVKMPGGFARLVMPSFNQMAEELSEELKLYKNDDLSSDKALQIHDIQVEDGVITLDPRLQAQ